jgi:AcrR family transcriptional regulator
MSAQAPAVLSPRKQPRQKRSEVTVSAVFEATIQVLLVDGPHRLTTTRVAERAGVSVGTLYQYFPNKRSLLYAVLERHLKRLRAEVVTAARSAHGSSFEMMVSAVVEAFVRVKLENPDEAKALYAVANELDTGNLIRQISEDCRMAIEAMLTSSPGMRFENPALVSFIFSTAMVGPTRAMLEGDAPQKMLVQLRAQLKSPCLSYLQREALADPQMQ